MGCTECDQKLACPSFRVRGSLGNWSMATNSAIEWTESTWNPVTGCTKVSPGCAYCYAERMSLRLQAMGQANYVNGFKVTLHEHALDLPLRWKKPQMIFVNSMSDLFHEEVPLDFIRRIFDVMNRASWHRFQILTKRSSRLALLAPALQWPGNVRCRSWAPILRPMLFDRGEWHGRKKTRS